MRAAKVKNGRRAPVRALSQFAKAGESAMGRLRHDAEMLVQRKRTTLKKTIGVVRQDVLARAQRAVKELDRAVRDVEDRIVKQLHVATEEKVAGLERRLVKLERLVAAERARAGSRAA